MKTITLARKPIVGTVAKNVLEHGSGGLNIDASRIGVSKSVPSSVSRTSSGSSVQGFSDGSLRNETGNENGHNPNVGRFPANLILQHLEGCEQSGTKVVSVSGSGSVPSKSLSAPGLNTYGDWKRTRFTSYKDKDGKESVANWICEDGCPVKALDGQSGESISSGGINARTVGRNGIYGAYASERGESAGGFGDIGGASRFFKQVKP